jgi:hypothetical protein
MRFVETQHFNNDPMDIVTKSPFATASYNAGRGESPNLAQKSRQAWIKSQPVVQ